MRLLAFRKRLIKFYIKRRKDSLYLGYFLKVVYIQYNRFRVSWIKLWKLKFPYCIEPR